MMTVKELIEKLQSLPPDARVFYIDPEYGDCFVADTTCAEAKEVVTDDFVFDGRKTKTVVLR